MVRRILRGHADLGIQVRAPWQILHRCQLFNICVARPVGKAEVAAPQKARKAVKVEWGKSWEKM
eukprot:11219249-Lingulodinium_polyedra.AAC.1